MFGKLGKILSGSEFSPGKPVAAPVATDPVVAADALIAEGNRAEQENNLAKACDCYRRAVEAAPRYANAHLNLGIGLEATGNAAGACKAYESTLAIDPGNAFANYNLGRQHFAAGRPGQAEPLLRQALASNPRFPDARVILSGVLELRGELEAAAAELEAALRDRPDYLGALNNYADLLLKLGRKQDAQAALRKALALQPDHFSLNYQLAQLLVESGSPEAEACLRKALKSRPDSVEVLSSLVNFHLSRGELSQAADAAAKALALRPQWPELLFNAGLIARRQKRLDDAEDSLRRAIALKPDFEQAYQMLASVLVSRCRMQDALAVLAEGSGKCKDAWTLESAELFILNYLDEAAPGELFARHADFGRRLESREPMRFNFTDRNRNPARKLRIGFISPDFKEHVVPQFLLPLLQERNRSDFEVACYSTGDTSDALSGRLRSNCDIWRPAAHLDGGQIAKQIHEDRIDILVDLAGHSSVPNLPVFARRPAPIQVTWLGYLNTTGLSRVDYRLSDRFSDPPGLTDTQHTEKLFRLPSSQWCYRPFEEVEFDPQAPVSRNGFVTFGSFNQAMKTVGAVRKLWAEILRRVPDSKLLAVGFADTAAQESFLQELERGGVDRARITMAGYLPSREYFRHYARADIALDTMPFSGGTTTFDALYMGVPVITMPGTRPWSRSAGSVLANLGLEDWIADSPEDYVERAVRHAGNPARIAGLRPTLRPRLRGSALMDAKRFARDVEGAWRQMWKTWCEQTGG